MADPLSVSNVLQALYESSSTIKMYVDTIISGQPAPYTLITKTEDHVKNEQIVQRVRDELKEEAWLLVDEDKKDEFIEDMLREILDEAMILEEEKYEVVYSKDGKEIEGSRRIAVGGEMQTLKDYCDFKGYDISYKKVE